MLKLTKTKQNYELSYGSDRGAGGGVDMVLKDTDRDR